MTDRLVEDPAVNPNIALSNPGSRLPSPTMNTAGLSPVESTNSPVSNLIEKYSITFVPGPIGVLHDTWRLPWLVKHVKY